jgi:hypothetical protein
MVGAMNTTVLLLRRQREQRRQQIAPPMGGAHVEHAREVGQQTRPELVCLHAASLPAGVNL